MQKVTLCLWFDGQAEEAAKFYISIFKNGSIEKISHYGKEGYEMHKRPAGSIMTVEFTLNGQTYIALNGGPDFKFTPATSLTVNCETQEEVDYFWEALAEGGKKDACGWLRDKFGLSWQIIPTILSKLMDDSAKSEKVMKVMLQMKKLDIAKLKAAAES
ncbi:MAG: VOC family protein [Gammaproteobacteria bacterium]|nr:VOC family protein [Gammaproteobacteria bacterium]